MYLAASAFAAQRPTKRYLERMRTLAIELRDSVPEYSAIPLPSYFDDSVTDAFFEKTKGSEDNFNIGTLASSLAELAEWKAKEQEDITNVVKAERDQLTTKLDMQTQSIINDAVTENKKKLGLSGKSTLKDGLIPQREKTSIRCRMYVCLFYL